VPVDQALHARARRRVTPVADSETLGVDQTPGWSGVVPAVPSAVGWTGVQPSIEPGIKRSAGVFAARVCTSVEPPGVCASIFPTAIADATVGSNAAARREIASLTARTAHALAPADGRVVHRWAAEGHEGGQRGQAELHALERASS
jgi:hypothetical protein